MKRISLFIIEDNDADYDLLKYRLNKAEDISFELNRGKNLAASKQYIANNHMAIDLILMDLNLPDSDYKSSIAQIAQLVLKAPIIVLTSQDISVGYEAIRNGAQDFMVKDGMDFDYIGYKIQYAIERASHVSQLKKAAFIDALTGDYTVKYLEHLLEEGSVIRQELKNMQLMVLDLHFSMETQDLLEDFEDYLRPLIKLLSSRIGLSHAYDPRHKYFFLLDDDQHQYTYLQVELERLFKDYLREKQLPIVRYGIGSAKVETIEFFDLLNIAEQDVKLLSVTE